MTQWTAEQIPNQSGKVIIITGANSGLGYESALALARKQAMVIMTARNLAKGEAARLEIIKQVPRAEVKVMRLDLADLSSVAQFVSDFKKISKRLDVLMNNAGLMAIPQSKTADGFEMQFGTNHLGHFALTAHLLPLLLQTSGSRVVTVSSSAHRMGAIDFEDLQSERAYSTWSVYAQSKLANLLFAFELQRQLTASGAQVISNAAHPGYSATNLQHKGPEMVGSRVMGLMMTLANGLFAQSSAMGALPQLYAATAPDAQGGVLYGPNRLGGMWGYPQQETPRATALDEQVAARLWQVSEQLTGVRYSAALQPLPA